MNRMFSIRRDIAWALSLVAIAACSMWAAAGSVPAPRVDAPLASQAGERTAVLAGGCFWGIEALYEHVKGVKDAVSGYAGGPKSSAHYETVSTGATGHAESVRVTYDPSQITYGQILRVFFSVAHDPTQVNRQGPDVGPQYRSAIFCANAEERRIAESYIAQLEEAKVFSRRIATEVTDLAGFYPAEPHHQDYAARNPDDPYIVINDAPKVANLRKVFPELYVRR
jgi:peptide-methionine (S)-S-oxide reductase